MFNYHGTIKPVVACKDFVPDDMQLLDFASVKNQIIDSNSNGYGTDITDILDTIEKQTVIDSLILKDRFWKMFVIDALIGNWDRHNGNWGFLYNKRKDSISLAPIYDCGSCLYPQIDEQTIEKVLSSVKEQNLRIYNIPTSAITENGSRINYYEFLSKHKYKECDEALKEICSKVDLNKINNLIDSFDSISENRKIFIKTMLKLRYEKILKANCL